MWPQTTWYQMIFELFSHILKSRGEFNNCFFLIKSLKSRAQFFICCASLWWLIAGGDKHYENTARKTSGLHRVQQKSVCRWIQSYEMFLHAGLTCVSTLLSHHNACILLDALRGTPLRTDGDPSGFHRTRRDQQTPHKHRDARNAQAEGGGGGGGGVDISTLPDNMTRVVVRSKQLTLY